MPPCPNCSPASGGFSRKIKVNSLSCPLSQILSPPTPRLELRCHFWVQLQSVYSIWGRPGCINISDTGICVFLGQVVKILLHILNQPHNLQDLLSRDNMGLCSKSRKTFKMATTEHLPRRGGLERLCRSHLPDACPCVFSLPTLTPV